MKSSEIIVVGSGLVGALLARVLADRGHHVQLFERRPDLRRVDISAGRSINLALSDRGWRALSTVGLDNAVRDLAIPMRGRRMHAKDGSLSYQPYGQGDQAIYSVSRGGLNGILMDHADAHPNVEIHFSQRCVSVDLDEASVCVEGEDGQQRTVTGDVILGADGAFSAVRKAMMTRPRFNYAQEFEAHGYKELTIPPAAGEGDSRFRLDANALHIWPRGGFMLIALPNLDGSFTVTLFMPYEGTQSFSALQTEEDVLTFFKAEFPDTLAHMPHLAQEFFENPTGDLVTVRCGPWNVAGRACLLGDAAHAIVPFYGQGMNSGFEDCRVLADLMDAEATDSADWTGLLTAFSAARKPNGDAIAELARLNFIEMRDRVADPQFLLQKKIEARIHQLYGERYLPLYSMVTFSHLPYAEALERGKKHQLMMDQLLRYPDIESIWQSEKGDALLREAVERSSGRS